MKKQNVSKEFALAQEPVDYQISVHVQNLIATYGEKKVKATLKELFNVGKPQARKKSKVG